MYIELENGKVLKVMVIENEGLYEYYVSGEKIGVFAPKTMEDNILILQNTLGNELSDQIKDEINAFDRTEIQEEGRETKILKEYAEKIGIEKVKDIYEIDLSEEEKEEDKDSDNSKSEKDDKKKKEKKPVTTKDVNVKQEVDLLERANDMHDIKRWLGANIPSKFTKIAVIYGDDMSKMSNQKGEKYKNLSTTYALALVDKDNNIEPLQNYIPNLQQRSAVGNNPTEQKYQVDKDGRVEQDAILSEWELGNKIIQLDNKELGRVEVHIGQEEHGGNETLGQQVRDSNSIYVPSTQMRSAMGEYESEGEYVVDENLKEVKQHEKQNSDCEEELTYEDIDGDSSTKSHEHITDEYVVDENGEKYTYEELATRWGKYNEGKPDVEAVKEWFKEKEENEPDKTVKELIENGDEEYEDPRAPGRTR